MRSSRWGQHQIFGDSVIAAAILDRLLHHSVVFAIDGPGYRLKGKLSGHPGGGDSQD